MKQILLRADDLGYSEGVNYGIAKSVIDGMITSVGVMTNMPSVQHGLQLLEGVEVCYGQHTNICAGRPVCDPKLIPSITTPSGEFKSSKEYRNATEDFVVLEEVILEIEAQYHRFVELIGRKPQYFEGHAVSSANFFRGLEIVAKKYGLKYSGLALGDEACVIGNTNVYMWMGSMQEGYDPKAYLKHMVAHAHEGCCDMMVCHPGYLDAYILSNSSLTIPRPFEVSMACDKELQEWIKQQDVAIISHDDL